MRVLADVSLQAPWGLLVCAPALVPVVALAVAFARQRRVALELGLEPVPGRRALRAAAPLVLACLLVGIAAARPVMTTRDRQMARTESEVVFVTDISRSMLASARAGAPTRLERARAVIRRLRAAVPDVPAGLAGLTDRALPYAFPTLDEGVFDDALKRSVLIDAPQPQGVSSVATNFQSLGFLARNGFYSSSARHRTCVVVTDGETRSVLPGARGCALIVVRVGGAGDRIFAPNGRVVADYRPESSAPSTLGRLARAAGGVPYAEGNLGPAVARLRSTAQLGPRSPVGTAATVHPLAPYLVALALTIVAAVILRRCLRPAGGVLTSRGRREGAPVEV